jgi:hypothetical protein
MTATPCTLLALWDHHQTSACTAVLTGLGLALWMNSREIQPVHLASCQPRLSRWYYGSGRPNSKSFTSSGGTIAAIDRVWHVPQITGTRDFKSSSPGPSISTNCFDGLCLTLGEWNYRTNTFFRRRPQPDDTPTTGSFVLVPCSYTAYNLDGSLDPAQEATRIFLLAAPCTIALSIDVHHWTSNLKANVVTSLLYSASL